MKAHACLNRRDLRKGKAKPKTNKKAAPGGCFLAMMRVRINFRAYAKRT